MPPAGLRLIGLIVPLVAFRAGLAGTPPADLVFTGGAVYTVNSAQPWAEAVAVRNGRIVYVGDDAGVTAHTDEGTRVIDLDGRMLLPGFYDSHMHPMAAGTRFLRCRLYGLAWPEEVVEALSRCAEGLAEDEWLRGVGLDEAALVEPGPGTALLDAVSGGHPAYVTTHDGYVAWVNARTLEIAGMDSPLSGILRGEPSAQIYALLPPYPEAELREALHMASQMANRFGITSVNAAKVKPEHHSAYAATARAGELTLRVQASLYWDPERGMEQLGNLIRRRDEGAGRRYRADAVKLFLDGSIALGTAALLEPYADTVDDRGSIRYPQDRLNAIVTALDAAGFQFHAHAFGDRAVRSALDAIQHAAEVNGPRDRRHHLAHLALVDPADVPRFAELGVAADYHGLWAYLGEGRREEIARVGPQHARRYMTIHDMFASGALVVGGSDWISESMNPLYSIQVAVTRRPPDGSGPAWNPDQRATLEEMIRAYTINGARLARQEHETGSIEVGKAADLVVLERNLFEVKPLTLKDVRVLLTLLEGEVVYQAHPSGG